VFHLTEPYDFEPYGTVRIRSMIPYGSVVRFCSTVILLHKGYGQIIPRYNLTLGLNKSSASRIVRISRQKWTFSGVVHTSLQKSTSSRIVSTSRHTAPNHQMSESFTCPGRACYGHQNKYCQIPMTIRIPQQLFYRYGILSRAEPYFTVPYRTGFLIQFRIRALLWLRCSSLINPSTRP
jgi:hypothetical protein